MKLDHIGIAVSDLEESRHLYRDVLGMKVGEPEELPERKLRICFVHAGEVAIELLFPTDPDSPVGKFLAQRGPGIHHLCYAVDDIHKKLSELKAQGVRLLDEKPRSGAHDKLVAFVHPASTGSVLTELCQDA
jgi:methylmalonyl-CoA/ethylmalonyl-CoA epimerase